MPGASLDTKGIFILFCFVRPFVCVFVEVGGENREHPHSNHPHVGRNTRRIRGQLLAI